MGYIEMLFPNTRAIRKLKKRVRSIEAYLKRSNRDSQIHQYAIFNMSTALNELRQGSICIDCGAHKGLISEVFLRLGATVHAFEANYYLHNYLRFRLSDFVESGRLHPMNNAVWDREETIKLYMRDDFSEITMLDGASESSSILVEKTQKNIKYRTSEEKYLSVESIDLCKFIESLDKEVHILKIDVEGAEFDILIKLIESGLYKSIRHIFVETHDEKLPDLKEKAVIVRQLIAARDIDNIDLEWH